MLPNLSTDNEIDISIAEMEECSQFALGHLALNIAEPYEPNIIFRQFGMSILTTCIFMSSFARNI